MSYIGLKKAEPHLDWVNLIIFVLANKLLS